MQWHNILNEVEHTGQLVYMEQKEGKELTDRIPLKETYEW
jgi:hypothetical protein